MTRAADWPFEGRVVRVGVDRGRPAATALLTLRALELATVTSGSRGTKPTQVMHRLSHVDNKLNAMRLPVPNAAVSKHQQTDSVELWVQQATFRANGLPTSAAWVRAPTLPHTVPLSNPKP
jgi:uncharacterized protein YycO